MKRCYQCDRQVPYLFPDARCSKCTRTVPVEESKMSDEVVEIKRETEKAYLIDHGGNEEVWAAKSQVSGIEKAATGPTYTLTVPEWLAMKEGFI